MSTIATRPAPLVPPPSSQGDGFDFGQGDQRIVIRGVGRHVYHCLSEAIGEGQHVRLAYDGKDLEIMTIGDVHEHYRERFSKLVNAVTSGLDIDYISCGEATRITEEGKGLEADLSYYFTPEKIQVKRDALARKSMDQADYPAPDLAVEIDISRPKVNRPGIYADLRVTEVWRFLKGEQLIIEHLQDDGSYAPVEESRFLRLRTEEILRWVTADDASHEAAWNRRLNQWAMRLGGQA